jgi:GTP cyclohydrolase I
MKELEASVNINEHDIVKDVKEKFGLFGLNVLLVLLIAMRQTQSNKVEFRLDELLRAIGEKPDAESRYTTKQFKRVKKVLEFISSHEGYTFMRVPANQEVING